MPCCPWLSGGICTSPRLPRPSSFPVVRERCCGVARTVTGAGDVEVPEWELCSFYVDPAAIREPERRAARVQEQRRRGGEERRVSERDLIDIYESLAYGGLRGDRGKRKGNKKRRRG